LQYTHRSRGIPELTGEIEYKQKGSGTSCIDPVDGMAEAKSFITNQPNL